MSKWGARAWGTAVCLLVIGAAVGKSAGDDHGPHRPRPPTVAPLSAAPPSVHQDTDARMLFVMTAGPLAPVIRASEMEWAPADYSNVPNVLSASGRLFRVDQNAASARWTQGCDAGSRLRVSTANLAYGGQPVRMPPGVAMRNVQKAVLWRGWVVMLGTTSQTDDLRESQPAELVWFNEVTKVARVKFLWTNGNTDYPFAWGQEIQRNQLPVAP